LRASINRQSAIDADERLGSIEANRTDIKLRGASPTNRACHSEASQFIPLTFTRLFKNSLHYTGADAELSTDLEDAVTARLQF
jgi:hypothetical protein